MDRFDKRAAGLLPCMFTNCYTAPKAQDDIHHESCTAHYRPAVATALRQCDKEAREQAAQVCENFDPPSYLTESQMWAWSEAMQLTAAKIRDQDASSTQPPTPPTL